MGWETPIKTDTLVAIMGATLRKENQQNIISDYQIKH